MMKKQSILKKRLYKKIICVSLAVLTAAGAASCSSPAKTTGGDNTLTISVVTKDRYLDLAVEKFHELHPEVTVKVEEYTSRPLPAGGNNQVIKVIEDPKDIEKYASTMNTQLMSGKGSDLLILNNLPYQKYADKGLLANLSDMISSDKGFDTGKYYSNILDAVKQKEKLYGIPLSFNIGVLSANKALLDEKKINIDDSSWSWDDFKNISEEIVNDSRKSGIQDMYVLSGLDEKRLITSLVESNYDKYVNKDKKTANFNSEDFIGLLNLSKYMLDNKLINTDVSQQKLIDFASRGKTVFSDSTLNTFMDLTTSKIMYSDGAVFLKSPGSGGSVSVTTNTMYGINNNSKNKELAWEFLKLMLSDDMMSQRVLGGFPINKNAFQTAAKDAMDMAKKGNVKLMLNGQELSPKQITQEDIDTVSNLVSKINKYADVDIKITSIIQEEVIPFFTGQKTAQDTAKTIQGRVNTYLNE